MYYAILENTKIYKYELSFFNILKLLEKIAFFCFFFQELEFCATFLMRNYLFFQQELKILLQKNVKQQINKDERNTLSKFKMRESRMLSWGQSRGFSMCIFFNMYVLNIVYKDNIFVNLYLVNTFWY